MNLKLSKEVICIKSHSLGIVTKGNIYPLIALKASPCVCTAFLVDVGVKPLTRLSRCKCGHYYDNGGIAWLNSELFAPVMDISEVMESVGKEQMQL